ncbi:cytochrome P450 [Streptomyces sp. NRRL F-5123]|uniref:cytochrome P450 n=1 Tax=Streptomyces sp. NRRL F-5123 TaxID=1463856 RepID=UPI0007C5C4E1|nr:cytochrome P450 [Streptomyces sp. NRRL F-5123]
MDLETTASAALKLRMYPPIERDVAVDILHGTAVHDPYRWLEFPGGDTPQWQAAQDRLWHRARDGWTDLPEWRRAADELYGLDLRLDVRRHAGRLFYRHRPPGADHTVLMVRDASGERLLLDPAAPGGEVRDEPRTDALLDSWHPSPDGALVVFQVSQGGTEDAQLGVLDTTTGRVVDGPVDRVRRSAVGWLPDGTGFYYVRSLEGGTGPRYHRRVFLHLVGTAPDTDREIFGAGLPATYYFAPSVTRDGRWLVVSASAGAATGTDLWLADLRGADPAQPALRPVTIGDSATTRVRTLPPAPDGRHTDGADGTVWLCTNRGTPWGRVAVTRGDDPGPDTWRTLIPSRPGAVLEDVVPLHGPGGPVALVAWTRHAVSELTLHDLSDGRLLRHVDLPGAGQVSQLAQGWGDPHEVWFRYEDHVSPPTAYRFDTRTAAAEPWPAPAVPVLPDVAVRREECVSADGTPVALFVLHPAADTRPAPRPRPAVLTGYGGFGMSMTPTYFPLALAWVRAGGVFAVACLRGGGEGGEEWHRAGTGRNKPKVFDDFEAAADHLVTAGWTSAERLGVLGESNGGLLAAAAMTRRPGAYAAVVCLSPLTDMVRYERSGRGPSWRGEYGTVDDPDDFRALLAYSPYHQVRQDARYPAVLLAAGANDTRVDPLHSRKLCAALQDVPGGRGPVLLRLEPDTGHGARPAGHLTGQVADVLAFLGHALNLPAPGRRTADGPVARRAGEASGTGPGTAAVHARPAEGCPFGGGFLDDPHAAMAAQRAAAPVARVRTPSGRPVWLVTRADDVRQVLTDPRLSLAAGHRAVPGAPLSRTLVNYDPPDHTRLRRLVSALFSPAALRPHLSAIEARAGALLDALDTSHPVDLLADFAHPFTFQVMADLFGVAAAARPGLSSTLGVLFRRENDAGAKASATARVETYFRDEIRRRAAGTGSVAEGEGADRLSALVASWRATGSVTEDEAVSLCGAMLLGGYESTAQMIAVAARELYRRPELPRRLRRGTADVRDAVEEVLRLDTPGPSATPRTALRDMEIGGVRIPAGDRVVGSIIAANRDPEHHRVPDALDLDRPDAGRHLTFGLGAHYCPGASLARVELTAAVTALTSRYSRLDPVEEPRWTGTFLNRGMAALIVRLMPAAEDDDG